MRGLIVRPNAKAWVVVAAFLVTMSAGALRADRIVGAELVDHQAMEEVCESSATVSVDRDGHFQCSICPSYTDFHANHESFNLESAYKGHFSTTGAEQLLLILSGCQTHATGFGGSVLLTQAGAAWKKSGFFAAGKPSKCLSFKALDHLDELVCEQDDMRFGTSTSWIKAVSYRDNSLHEETLLSHIDDNTAGGAPKEGYCFEQDIASFKNSPSKAGFLIVITQMKDLASPGQDSCGFNAKRREQPKQTLKLHFLFDGDHFSLAQESNEELRKLQSFLPKTKNEL